MIEDRRTSTRHPVSLHAQIETDAGRSTIAVTQDVSAGGLLVLSHQLLEVDQGVTLHVLLDKVQHEVSGKVVRQEPLAHGESSLWRTKVAVAIDTSDPQLAKIIAALARVS
jgi:hypothetical protein